METHHLSLERRPKERRSSDVSPQGCAHCCIGAQGLLLCSQVSVSPCLLSPLGSLTVGSCTVPSTLCGFHQSRVLHLQLLLHVRELQTGGDQEGLPRGEPSRREVGEEALVLRQPDESCCSACYACSCSHSHSSTEARLSALQLTLHPTVSHVALHFAGSSRILPGALCLVECVFEREGERQTDRYRDRIYSKKNTSKATYRPTGFRPLKKYVLCPLSMLTPQHPDVHSSDFLLRLGKHGLVDTRCIL